jgi:hypothetical protein
LHIFPRIIQVFVFSIILLPTCLYASGLQDNGTDHHLGVYITQEEQVELSPSAFERLRSFGFTIVELEGRAPLSLLDTIIDSDFYIFANQTRKFVTPYQLQQNDNLYFQEDLSLIRFYEEQAGERVSAYSFFNYPDDRSSFAAELLNRYVNRFAELNLDDKLYYYRSAYPALDSYPSSFSFRSTKFSGKDYSTLPSRVIHFEPADTTLGSLIDLKRVMELSLQTDQSIIFISYSWLIEKLNRFELLGDAFNAYSRNQTVLFPEPHLEDQPLSPNWTVILLIVLIGSYLIHYRNSPVYQRSLLRFFTMHKFLVEDILENRLRTSNSALILFTQHIILTGLLFYILSKTLISPLGLEALYHHFTFLSIFGYGSAGIFIFGLCISLLLQTISVVWIHLVNRKTRLNQVVTLYCWPLQLNLIIVVVVTAIYQVNGHEGWLIFMSILFLVIWFFSFNITALDVAKSLKRYRVIYIIFTVGIHVLIIIILVTLMLIYAPVSEPVRMAFNFP